MNPASRSPKPEHVVVGAVVQVFSDNHLPDNRANNRHSKENDYKRCCARENPKHKMWTLANPFSGLLHFNEGENALARANPGNNKLAKIAMIAMTTRSSIR